MCWKYLIVLRRWPDDASRTFKKMWLMSRHKIVIFSMIIEMLLRFKIHSKAKVHKVDKNKADSID